MSVANSEDYVAMGQHVCPVCGEQFNSGEILISKTLRGIPKDKRVTGMSLCPEHKKLHEEGYCAFVVVDNPEHKATLKMQEANRTGEVLHIRRTVANKIFNADFSAHLGVFIDVEAAEKIKSMIPEAQNGDEVSG